MKQSYKFLASLLAHPQNKNVCFIREIETFMYMKTGQTNSNMDSITTRLLKGPDKVFNLHLTMSETLDSDLCMCQNKRKQKPSFLKRSNSHPH